MRSTLGVRRRISRHHNMAGLTSVLPTAKVVPVIFPHLPISCGRVIVLEGQDWLPDVMRLHAEVRTRMAEHERHFLLPKTEDYFSALLAGKNGALLGALVDGRLAGCIAVVKADDFAHAKAEGRLTYPDADGAMAASCGKAKVAIAQSMCVQDEWVGQRFSRVLVQAAIAWAQEEGCAHLFAQVAQDNVVSWLRFLYQDFAIVAAWEAGHGRFLVRHLTGAEKIKKQSGSLDLDEVQVSKRNGDAQQLVQTLNEQIGAGRCVMLQPQRHDPDKLHFVFA